jgi:hypothetical protein
LKIPFKDSRVELPEILIAILTILNLFFTSLPLVKILGFEHSALNGIILFYFSGLLTIKIFRKSNDAGNKLLPVLSNYGFYFLMICIIPFVIGLISSIFMVHCPLIDGILFYIIISLPSFFFGIAAGYLSYTLSKKFSYLIFSFSYILILLSPLIEFYYNPQIYFYNPIFGFYPGVVFDEDLTVDKLLIAYRLFNIVYFAFMIFIAKRSFNKKTLYKLSMVGLLILTAVVFSILKPIFNFATDSARLNKILNRTVGTEHFNIHFSDTIEKKSRMIFSALLHEYYLDQINIQLNEKYPYRIDSYIFDDGKMKRELFGAGNADVAKPWMNQIYLNYSGYANVLKHEIVHDAASVFGTTPLKVSQNFNPAMIEGIAMAIENSFDGYPVHYMAKLAYQAGYRIAIDKLYNKMNFLFQVPAISYIYSGSFIRYLIDQYGIEKVKKVYSDMDFSKYFGKDINELNNDYELFLKNYRIDFNKNKAQLYFGGSTIFKKYCPRTAAAETKKAWELYNWGKNEEAGTLFRKVYEYSGSYQSLFGLQACLTKTSKYSEAEKLLTGEIHKFAMSPYKFILELLLGDLMIQTGKGNCAVCLYDSLLVQNPHIDFINEVLIRKEILKDGADSLKVFFNKNETQKFKRLFIMNKINTAYYFIPDLIRYAENNKIDISSLIAELKGNLKVTDYSSAYAALEISIYSLSNFEYDTARFFAVRSLEFIGDENIKHRFAANLRMVNWFRNTAEETKKTFRIN